MTSFILVMACAIAAGWIANRIHVPYPIVLVLAGIGVGVAFNWPALQTKPDLVLAIVLPAVLYPAAIETSWRDFRRSLRPILLLAIGLVATTTLAVGLALKRLVPGAPWAVCFALGAIVSPPDAVAATAVLRRFRLPRRITALLEGESLVNDATGLVLYRFAVVAALTGVFSGWEMVGQFGLIAVGGVLLGIAMGWITSQVQERLDDPMLELAMSLTTPFATYWLCEWLQVSGVLGVVAVGLYRSRWGHLGISPLARLNILTFWRAVVFVVNCLVFVLIGIQLPAISSSLIEQQALNGPGVAGLVAILSCGRDRRALSLDLHRDLWRAPAAAVAEEARSRLGAGLDARQLVRHARRRLARRRARHSRGVTEWRSVSVSRPRDPARLRHRVRDAGGAGADAAHPRSGRCASRPTTRAMDELELAREAMRRAAIRAVDTLVEEHGMPAHEAVSVKRFFDNRSTHRTSSALALDSEARLWLGAAAAQRDALIRLWRNDEIGDDVLGRLEREIDLAEARLARDD